jgi:hypothetical protein
LLPDASGQTVSRWQWDNIGGSAWEYGFVCSGRWRFLARLPLIFGCCVFFQHRYSVSVFLTRLVLWDVLRRFQRSCIVAKHASAPGFAVKFAAAICTRMGQVYFPIYHVRKLPFFAFGSTFRAFHVGRITNGTTAQVSLQCYPEGIDLFAESFTWRDVLSKTG